MMELINLLWEVAVMAAIAYIWASMRHHRHLFFLLERVIITQKDAIEKLTDNGSLCETCLRAKTCKSKPMRPNVH